MSSAPIENEIDSDVFAGTVRLPDNRAAWNPFAPPLDEPVPFGGKKLDGTLNGRVTTPVPVWETKGFRDGAQYVISPPAVKFFGPLGSEKQFETHPKAGVFRIGRAFGPRILCTSLFTTPPDKLFASGSDDEIV